MPARDESARDPVRQGAETWAAESPLVGEAAAEEQAQIHPWYQGRTPFVEGRELGEIYAPEPEGESGSTFEGEFAFEEPGIIAGENRVRVKKTDGVPWRWICKIAVKDRQDRYFAGGTGVLISHRHVLTAAHVVYPEYSDPYNYSVEVIPALDGGDEPFGTYSLSATPRIPKNYNPQARDHLDWDYALLTLKDRVGEKTFSRLGRGPLYYWGHPTGGANTIFVRPDPRTLNGKPVLTAGYPNSKGFDPRRGGTQLWCAAGMLHSADRRRRKMSITADTTKGQSGSPVWVVENGRYCLVGIAVGAGQQSNFVVRVTRELIRQLRAWIAEDGETPSIIETEEELESPAPSVSHPAAEHYSASEWSSKPAAEEAEDFTSIDYEVDGLQPLHEQPLEERFDPSSIPDNVADALRKKDWPLALKLAIQAGWRDENDLTNLVFFGRHQELPSEKLDPTGPNFKQLSAEWTKILNDEVWKAIELSAENTDLVVSGEEVTDHHRRFFRGKSGKRLKNLVEAAAREVDLNPGLLGTIMMAETRRPQSYLSSERVGSYHIGADDFYEGRAAIKARVPAYARVKWDKNQTPSEHLNDAKTNRRIVKTILFDSGPDAVLATAVYLKFREVRLREVAAEMKGDFDNLPLATRFALTRMAMAAGTAGATPFLKDALKGADIFVRRAIPVRAYQTQRNATVRTAQAMHLSDWIFGIPVPAAAAQPELETFEDFNEELEEFYDFDADSSSLEPGHHELDGRVPPEGELFHGLAVEEAFNEEGFADLEDELSLEPYESETRDLLPEEETTEGLTKKLRLLSLLPHTVEASGTDVSLTPSVMDPGIYDGPEKYKIAPKLQESLMGVMNKREYSHVKVTLVDLTKDTTKPEFAGFNHKSQVFAASVPKIAAMLAAFQLRHDLRASLKQKGSKTLDELFALVRDGWVATQAATQDKATPLTFGVSLKRKLVLVQGEKISLGEPKAPQLESVFAGVKVGSPVTIEFQSTGENKDQLKAIIDDFNKTKKGAKEKLDALGFLERMRIMIGGLVPASNYATSTIVRDVGFLYIASALIQSGLYDTNRKGGLWLGADYWGSKWRGPLGGGVAQSATAGSLAAFMTLLAQNRLVSPRASTEMGALMKKEPNPTHPGIVSWFKEGLKGLKDGGTLNLVLSKLGAHSGVDDCTLIEREVDLGDSKKVLRYVAVGLRARSPKELKSLILELDKCILANNGLTPAQGGHS